MGLEGIQESKWQSLRKSLRFALRIYWRDKKSTLLICLMAVFLRVLVPYIGILMPKWVIDLLEAHATPERFLLVVGGAGLGLVALNYLKGFSDAVVNHSIGTVGVLRLLIDQKDKLLTMDYDLMQDEAFQAIEEKSNKAMQSNHAPAMNLPRTLVELLSNLLGFLVYAGVLFTVHPLIIAFLAVSAAINWFALSRARRYRESMRDANSKLEQQVRTMAEVLRDPAAQKDIRLYSAYGWLDSVMRALLRKRTEGERKVARKQMWAQLTDSALNLLRDGAAYAFLVYLVLRGDMTLGNFVLSFAAIGAMAGWISNVLIATSELFKAETDMSDIRAYLDFPDRMNRGAGVALPTGDALPPSLELCGVGYTYPNAEKPTLRDVDIRIRPGERIAIVGANGAGKTTLVKLICGLCMPTEGEVRVNAQPFPAYNRDEYYSLFSTVFQDIHLLSSDIAGNVSQKTEAETDFAKVRQCLAQSGLLEKIDSLPQRERTKLVRSVHADAIELSGGEKQKLAMARALYRDAPVIILDEPTAALDPIAENEVYQKYAELTAGKTSIFISHRLASTRFCDRILLLEGCHITEEGTHEQLMRLGGTYAHMFDVQASYYRQTAAGGEALG